MGLYDLNKFKEALEYFDKAININPSFARAWHQKGMALLKLGKNAEAKKCFGKAKVSFSSKRNNS